MPFQNFLFFIALSRFRVFTLSLSLTLFFYHMLQTLMFLFTHLVYNITCECPNFQDFSPEGRLTQNSTTVDIHIPITIENLIS